MTNETVLIDVLFQSILGCESPFFWGKLSKLDKLWICTQQLLVCPVWFRGKGAKGRQSLMSRRTVIKKASEKADNDVHVLMEICIRLIVYKHKIEHWLVNSLTSSGGGPSFQTT